MLWWKLSSETIEGEYAFAVIPYGGGLEYHKKSVCCRFEIDTHIHMYIVGNVGVLRMLFLLENVVTSQIYDRM